MDTVMNLVMSPIGVGALATLITAILGLLGSKWKAFAKVDKAFDEVVDVLNAYKAAKADGKIDKAETELIIKEIMDVVKIVKPDKISE